MRFGRLVVEFCEWIPVLLAPIVVYFLTESFTRRLDLETWLALGFVLAVNLAWIGFTRWQRHAVEFYEKYPNFRMKKRG